ELEPQVGHLGEVAERRDDAGEPAPGIVDPAGGEAEDLELAGSGLGVELVAGEVALEAQRRDEGTLAAGGDPKDFLDGPAQGFPRLETQDGFGGLVDGEDGARPVGDEEAVVEVVEDLVLELLDAPNPLVPVSAD